LQATVTYAFDTIPTPWGAFTAVFSDAGLVATYLPDGESGAERRAMASSLQPRHRKGCARPLAQLIKNYFAGKVTHFGARDLDVPLDLSFHTPFRQAVLDACRKVPYGNTASYQDLARAVGSPNATRAVGTAMANNPMPLIVPCHRILRADGSLGGFSAPDGANLKRRLLNLEAGAVQN
jgi:methylated-DNA-[protein]-cysteine S-methyltransferase